MIAVCLFAGLSAGSVWGAASAPLKAGTNGVWRAEPALLEPMTVEGRPGYNCWPMVQAVGNRLVCAYSVGRRHDIGDGFFGTYARTSDDCGRTWSEPVLVLNDPKVGEEAVGKGLDENGDMLLWVRRCTSEDNQVLYRTHDGRTFERIAAPKLDPKPTQITDVIRVPGKGLMCMWFACTYSEKRNENSWGTLVSRDNGLTWTQKTVEGGLPLAEAATEPAIVCLKDGRLLGIARRERGRGQVQITSTDGGETWTKRPTNIADVMCSTPSLLYSPGTGLVSNYYYQRGKGLLKRRVCKADEIFNSPMSWPEPELMTVGGRDPADAGNANATRLGDRDYISYYSGKAPDTRVLLIEANAR